MFLDALKDISKVLSQLDFDKLDFNKRYQIILRVVALAGKEKYRDEEMIGRELKVSVGVVKFVLKQQRISLASMKRDVIAASKFDIIKEAHTVGITGKSSLYKLKELMDAGHLIKTEDIGIALEGSVYKLPYRAQVLDDNGECSIKGVRYTYIPDTKTQMSAVKEVNRVMSITESSKVNVNVNNNTANISADPNSLSNIMKKVIDASSQPEKNKNVETTFSVQEG